jgi:hypothetical protein
MQEFNSWHYNKNDGTIAYIFKIPKEHLTDYELFLQGRYSDFSATYKLKILKFWGFEYVENNSLISILFDGKSWPKPLISREKFHKLH